MSKVPTRVGDRFELGEKIGVGSLSAVYAAIDSLTGEHVAVKLASKRARGEAHRRRFEREAGALAVLGNPHVIRLIAAGEIEPSQLPYLVLERLRGSTLAEELLGRGSLPPTEVATWIGQAAQALELAHGLGMVHRDLKPANLFLHEPKGEQRLLKVLDFGLVQDTDADSIATLGDDGRAGTPLYMAPEQVRGQSTRIGPATDVWAIAMVTTTLLTGEDYWSPGSALHVIQQVDASPLYAPSSRWKWLMPAFDKWFGRATERVAERRFRSVTEQADRLSEVLAGVSNANARPESFFAQASTVSSPTPLPKDTVLPSRQRPFIGRAVEKARLAELLTDGALVTVTGTAGVGKSRLAQAVASELGNQLPDGAWFVAVPAAADVSSLAAAILETVGLEPDGAVPALDQVAVALSSRRTLVVLDDLVQSAEVAAALERLRRECPHARWLVTSRLPPEMAEAHVLNLHPLDVPPAGASVPSPAEARSYEAVRLFVACAKVVDPTFEVTTDNVDDVVTICRMIDGLPLGIEVAAARADKDPLAQIRAGVESRIESDPIAAVHQTLRWSYGLLSASAQKLLRHVAAFPAGLAQKALDARFGKDAASAEQLVAANLMYWSTQTPPRLNMLDIVRDLGKRMARELGEDDALWSCAIAHAQLVVGRGSDNRNQARLGEWLAEIDAEQENIRSVLVHAISHAPPVALELAGELGWYWYMRGHYAEGAEWLEGALLGARRGDAESTARALHGAGHLALLRCHYDRARVWLEDCRRVARDAGDLRNEARAVQLLGSVARERGEYKTARELHRRSQEVFKELGDESGMARARNYLLFVSWLGDENGRPHDGWQDGAEREFSRTGDVEEHVWALLNRGAISYYAGDLDVARARLDSAFSASVTTRYQEGVAWALNLLGLVSLQCGELLQARARLYAALRVHRRLGDLWRCASVMEALATVAARSQAPQRAALYLGAADSLRARIGVPVPRCEQKMVAACVQLGELALGENFERARQLGRQRALDEIVALASELL